jgi:hypothetical protein
MRASFSDAPGGVGLLILDNLSSLTAAMRETDGGAWSPIWVGYS